MKNKKVKTQHDRERKIKRFLWILIGIALIFLVKNSYTFFDEMLYKSNYESGYNYSYMDYTFKDRDYIGLMRAVRINEVNNVLTGDDVEVNTFAYLYEAVIYYNMYREEDADKAAHYLEKINIYKEKLSHRIFLDAYEELKENYNL